MNNGYNNNYNNNNDKPKNVLANGDIVTNSGAIINSDDIKNIQRMVNNNSNAVNLKNNMVLLSNGNKVNTNSSNAEALISKPIQVLRNGDIKMSNGDTINGNLLKNVLSNNNQLNRNNKNGSRNYYNKGSSCPIAPPAVKTSYCTPAPYETNTDSKYFSISQAYGKPTTQ